MLELLASKGARAVLRGGGAGNSSSLPDRAEGARMGLAFGVGNPSDAFVPDYAERVRSRLAKAFGAAVVLDSAEKAYRSDECGWGGWARLQEAAANAVGADRVPHLLSMEAWNGCY